MFLLDQPYISDFFRHTLKQYQIPVVATPAALELEPLPGTVLVEPHTAVQQLRNDINANSANSPIYTTSENSINWIVTHLADTPLPRAINLFKDKILFRQRTRALFPELFFQRVEYAELDNLEIENFTFPFIIKPSVGFFSMGVHKVDSGAMWEQTCAAIHAEVAQQQAIYPLEVLDTATFIIEACIDGEEFAVDAYFDQDSNAVVVGIHQHLFASAHDVSDRVYITSKQIVLDHVAEFSAFATAIGKQLEVKNIPVHIELRRQGDTLLPIEVNPMRFGGWCSTADSTAMAFDFNPYLSYFTRQPPVWDAILAPKDATLHSVVVLDNSTGIEADKITTFDYASLEKMFENTLELRRTDYTRYNVFGFLFSATRPDNLAELEYILSSDLRDFVTSS